MKFTYLLTTIAALSVCACGTPQEIRSLSSAQLEAFSHSVSDRRETNQAFIAYVSEVNGQRVEELEAVYAATEAQAVTRLGEAETDQERLEILQLLRTLRASTDSQVQQLQSGQTRFTRSLNSQQAYLEAMSAAQQQLHTQIMTDDPLTRLLKRIVGVDEYNTYEARLNQLRLIVDEAPGLPTSPSDESE